MTTSLPAGPKPGLRQLFRYARAPYEYFQSNADSFGDPFTIHTLGGKVVMTGDPALVRQIFTADPDLFDVFLVDTLEAMLGPGSMFLLSGEKHRRARKLLAPPFHGARMRAYGDLIGEVTRERAAEWAPGSPLVMQQVTQSISLEVIIRAVFGVTEPLRQAQFRRAVTDRVHASHPAIVFMKLLRREFGGFGPWARFRRATEQLDRLLYREICERRASGQSGSDILSSMLQARYDDGSVMSDAEIRDELITLLIAGHETTASGLAWALYWLLRHPEVEGRLVDELAAAPADADLGAGALPYLQAVCQETLRLHPIVPDVVRRLKQPWKLGSYELPAGVGVGVALNLVHERADLYPDPQRFDPERFLKRNYTPFEYLPFGGGARRCIGAAFAMYEMRVALATLLRERRFRLNDPAVRPARRNFTLGPSTGVAVIYEGRRAA